MASPSSLSDSQPAIQPSTTTTSGAAPSNVSPTTDTAIQTTVAKDDSQPETSSINPAPSSPKSPSSPPNSSTSPLASKADNAVRISLLLTNGARHPFTINKKFLQRRNIVTTDDDPWNISVHDMKALIWHEWLAEWESRPSAPAYIRLIFLGGLLDDTKQLKDCRFSKTEPNVVHMTVKPQDLAEDEDMKSKENKGGSSSRGGGGCCIIL